MVISLDDRLGLLDELRSGRPTVSLITTYSIDFAFYEAVVLRKLNAAGCQHHLLLVDATRCGEALADPDRRPRLAGISYALVPIVRPGAFHPKVVILAGKKESRLFIGSHNTTMAGFGGNAEVTNSIAGGPSSSAATLIGTALDAIAGWLPVGVGGPADEIVSAARTLVGRGKPTSGDADAVVVCTGPGRPSLWEQLRPLVPKKPRRVLVTGPFFDDRLEFVQRAMAELGAAEFVVAIDPTYAMLDADVAQRTRARFVDARPTVESLGYGKTARIHAKAMLIEDHGRWMLVSGSANPSSAAWLKAGTNEEAVLVRKSVTEDELSRLGLRNLLDAPEITAAQWAEVAGRVRRDSLSTDSPRLTPALHALEDAGTITIRGATGAKRARLHFGDGSQHDVPLRSGADGAVTAADSSLDLSRCGVAEVDPDAVGAFALVNHVSALSIRPVGGSVRVDLRAALGAVSEDGARIEEVLKIVERALDDDDTSNLDTVGRGTREPAGQPGPTEAPLGPRSMSLENVRRRSARQRSLASGNIAIVIDLLVRRIGEGLPGVARDAAPREVEEGQLDPLEEAARAAPVEVDGHALVKACHRKLRRMLRKMVERLDHVMTVRQGAVRAIVQLAAVLGVLRWLRRIEPELSWLPYGESAIPDDARDELFWWAGTYAGLSRPSLLHLVDEEAPDGCDEAGIVLGLVAWLGFDANIDMTKPCRGMTGFQSHPSEDDLPWFYRSGILLAVVQTCVDSPALTVFQEAVRQSRGSDRDAWLLAHLRLGEAAALAALAPDDAPLLARPVRRGDLIRIKMPTGRMSTGFAVDVDDVKVRVADAENGEGRPVLKAFVAALDVPALVGPAEFAGGLDALDPAKRRSEEAPGEAQRTRIPNAGNAGHERSAR